MYLGRKKPSSEHASHIKRFLNISNEPLRRLKALRNGLDKVSVGECKQILSEYSAAAFYVFHSSFTMMESQIRERVSKGRAISDQLREMMEVILPSLERLIILLPELVQQKWQYNSICLIIRKLLHPENTIELRQYGIKLIVLWLQSLQDKAGDACIELLASAIPHFPPKKTPLGLPMETTPLTTPSSSHSLCERYGRYSSNETPPDRHDWVSTRIIQPLCVAQNVSSDPALSLMEYLLTTLTTQVGRLKWTDPANHAKGFSFLFFQFKLFYLVCLYKNFRSDAGLYSPIPPPTIKLPSVNMVSPPAPPAIKRSDESVGVWQKQPASSKHASSVSAVIKLDYDTSDPIYDTLRQLILKFVLKWIMPGFHSNRPGSIQPKVASPSPALASSDHSFTPEPQEMMREMWLSSRDNVNLLFEICHQAFHLPLSHPGVVNKLTELYSSWVQDSNKPLFMEAPAPPIIVSSLPVSPTPPPAPSLSVLPWEAISGYSKFDRSDVRAGLQSSLKMFIAHTSQLFLHQQSGSNGHQLEIQVDSGRRILKLYQEIVQQWTLDGETWLYLLSVLLHLTITLLYDESSPPPENRDTSLGGSIADQLLQTLLVSYVRCSMVMLIPSDYWNNLWSVLSSLTQWKEVIAQWKDVMRNTTHCLSRVVYQIDLDHLPLNHISDTHRPRTRTTGSAGEWSRKKSFSEYRPLPPQLSHSSIDIPSTIDSVPINRRLVKASTYDMTTNSVSSLTPPNNIDKNRRSSSPAVPRSATATGGGGGRGGGGGDKIGSTSLSPLGGVGGEAKRIFSKELTILEDEDSQTDTTTGGLDEAVSGASLYDDEVGVSDYKETPPTNILSSRGSSPIDTAPASSDSVLIVNSHTNLSPEPIDHTQLVSINVTTPSGGNIINEEGGADPNQLTEAVSLVISNEDVSSESESHTPDQTLHPTLPEQPIPISFSSPVKDQAPPSQSHPLRRSNSDSTAARPVFRRQDCARSTSRSRSPDPRYSVERDHTSSDRASSDHTPSGTTQSTCSESSFNQYIPEQKPRAPITWLQTSHTPLVPIAHVKSEPSPTMLVHGSTSPDRPLPPQVAEGEGKWTNVSVSLVWECMLRILGDINKIESNINHSLALHCIAEVWSRLEEIESNLGISLDNKVTPTLPPYMPPLQVFLPWVIKACSLPHNYQEGRKLAYQLLCDMILRHSDSSKVSQAVLPHFYRLVHTGLQPISDVINVTVKNGSHLLSYGLSGSSILLHDILVGCSHLLNSKATEVPRLETMSLLGSMYYILRQYSSTALPVPVSGGDTVLGEHLKEKLISTLYNSATKESNRQSRILALYQVGMMVYSELTSPTSSTPSSSSSHTHSAPKPSKLVPEGIDILLATLKFPDSSLSLSSLDMLTLLAEGGGASQQLKSHFPSYVLRLIKGLTSACAHLLSSSLRKNKVIISTLLCLRDWLMSLSINDNVDSTLLPEAALKDVFKVVYAAANIHEDTLELDSISSPVNLSLGPLDVPPSRSSKSTKTRHENEGGDSEDITIVARSVLSHLMNFLCHYPFMSGAACLSSTVCSYHDSPSLQYLDELSIEIFDSPRVQFFSINGNAILAVVEIPAQSKGLPINTASSNYQCRLILRDITGKYCWDASILHGSRDTVNNNEDIIDSSGSLPLIKEAESYDSLLSLSEDTDHSSPLSSRLHPSLSDPLIPPSWVTMPTTSGTDLLNELLVHVETTSPECLLFPGVGLAEPAPSCDEPTGPIESLLENLLESQYQNELDHQIRVESLPCMHCQTVTEPEALPSSFPFYYCRLFLSHTGYMSWQKRNNIELIEKTEQLVRELKHLDSTQAQCRQTYKVAVLYVANGQEDKASILSNAKGSHDFEEFVSGLGWEVDMRTHQGYAGGLSSSYTAGISMTYFASSTEEILFHVSTRMPATSGTDFDHKVRHLGNDEVHIVWSEHWRDYRRSILKTQFADVLIIIYPLPNGLYRIQIDKKNNIQFGPLYDGIVVDGSSLSHLVRATAINALRVMRTPLFMYRGKYEDRWKYIQSVTSRTVPSTYEDFIQSVIHPQAKATPTHPPLKLVLSATSTQQNELSSNRLSTPPPLLSSLETRWTLGSFEPSHQPTNNEDMDECPNSQTQTDHVLPVGEELSLEGSLGCHDNVTIDTNPQT